jgi:hypothetical protein
MGYSNFKSLKQSLKKLQIEEFDKRLFIDVKEVQPSEWLLKTIEYANEMPLTNEKSKSERLISPILLEATLPYKEFITLYSGEDLTVDDKQDLSGSCDFFIAKHPRKSVMQAPVITLCEAKDEDFDYGQGQCLAQMYAAQVFNEQEGHPQPFIYGCAVTGGEWKFLKLEKKQVLVDINTYYLNDLPKILGVFHQIIQSYLK